MPDFLRMPAFAPLLRVTKWPARLFLAAGLSLSVEAIPVLSAAEPIIVRYAFDNLSDPLAPSDMGTVVASSIFSDDPHIIGVFNTRDAFGANPGAAPLSPVLKIAPVPTRFNPSSFAAFSLQAPTGMLLELRGVYLDFAAGGNDAGMIYVRSSLDGFQRNLLLGSEPAPAVFSRYHVAIPNTRVPEITFRVYAASSSSRARDVSIDNITVLGITVPAP